MSDESGSGDVLAARSASKAALRSACFIASASASVETTRQEVSVVYKTSLSFHSICDLPSLSSLSTVRTTSSSRKTCKRIMSQLGSLLFFLKLEQYRHTFT